MKKIFVFIALFSLVFMLTSCGGGNEDSGTTDSGENGTPECSPSSETPCIDSESGLTWSAKAIEKMSWEDALNYCKDYSEKDISGWRLPDINEWRTLIQNCPGSVTGGSCAVKDSECLSFDSCWSEECRCTRCEDGRYSRLGDTDCFWSSSVDAGYTEFDAAWTVVFDSGDLYIDDKQFTYFVRCVRNAE